MTNIDDAIARAKRMIAGKDPEDVRWHLVAREVGISPPILMRRLRPSYREYRADLVRRQRYYRGGTHTADSRVDAHTVAMRRAEIPDDTRSPGARLLGDPIYERSALYKERAQ